MKLTSKELEQLYEILDYCECENKLVLKKKILSLLSSRTETIKRRVKSAVNGVV